MANYTNASRALVDEFNLLFEQFFSIKPSKLQVSKGKGLPWFQTNFYSKNVVDWLFKISPSFSASREIGVPKIIKQSGDQIVASFLRAFWEDEGSIDFRGRLSGSSKSKKMIEDLNALHKGLGIDSYLVLGKSNKIHNILLKRNHTNYLNFYRKIGFGKAVVKAGVNKGQLKQATLLCHINRMASI